MADYKCTKCNEVKVNVNDEGKKGFCPKCRLYTMQRLVGGPPKALSLVTKGGSTSSPPAPETWGAMSNEFLTRIFMLLDERALGLVSLVCRRWRIAGAELLKMFVPAMTGFGSGTTQLKGQLIRYMTGARTLDMAVDKFPCPSRYNHKGSVLEYLLKYKIRVNLLLGTKDEDTMQRLVKAGNSARLATAFHKMHNKFLVIDGEGVILGSPNVSLSGLEDGNLESCILIRSPRVGGLFIKYLELMKSPNPRKSLLWNEVRNGLVKYNSEQHNLKIAFAPVMNITNFIVKQLGGATKIIIRQYLISPKRDSGPGDDILEILCEMARNKVEIEVYIDESAYETQGFVKEACTAMVKSGIKVYTQKSVVVVNFQSESLQHDKLILATLHTGVCRTLIGSAGFTSDVIANNNAENFICTELPWVAEGLMAHHQATLKSEVARTKEITQ